MDDVIKIIQISNSEIKEIQLYKDLRKEVESASAISYQNDYKTEDLYININANEAKANDNDLA